MFKKEVSKIISTWFYSGLAPKAPGTFGSAATLPVRIRSCRLAGVDGGSGICPDCLRHRNLGGRTTYAKAVNIKDPGFIVIDETAGQAITLLAARNPTCGFILSVLHCFAFWTSASPGPSAGRIKTSRADWELCLTTF